MSATTLYYLGTNPITIKGFGWINATQAAQMSRGKPVDEWLTSSGGLYAMEQLADELGAGSVPGFFDLHRVQRDKKNFLIAVKAGRRMVRAEAGDTKAGGGLWLHPNLAMDFARWVDPNKIDHPFATWLAEQLPEVRRKHVQAAKAKREAEDQDLSAGFAGTVDAELLERMAATDAMLRNAGASMEARRKALAAQFTQQQEGGAA